MLLTLLFKHLPLWNYERVEYHGFLSSEMYFAILDNAQSFWLALCIFGLYIFELKNLRFLYKMVCGNGFLTLTMKSLSGSCFVGQKICQWEVLWSRKYCSVLTNENI